MRLNDSDRVYRVAVMARLLRRMGCRKLVDMVYVDVFEGIIVVITPLGETEYCKSVDEAVRVRNMYWADWNMPSEPELRQAIRPRSMLLRRIRRALQLSIYGYRLLLRKLQRLLRLLYTAMRK